MIEIGVVIFAHAGPSRPRRVRVEKPCVVGGTWQVLGMGCTTTGGAICSIEKVRNAVSGGSSRACSLSLTGSFDLAPRVFLLLFLTYCIRCPCRKWCRKPYYTRFPCIMVHGEGRAGGGEGGKGVLALLLNACCIEMGIDDASRQCREGAICRILAVQTGFRQEDTSFLPPSLRVQS